MSIHFGRLNTDTPVREKPATRPAPPERAPEQPAHIPEGLPDPGITRPDRRQPAQKPHHEPLYIHCFGMKLDRQA